MKHQPRLPLQWNVASNPSKTNSRPPWERPQTGQKKSKSNGKKSLQGILKKKGTPTSPKKSTAPRTPHDAQDANSKGSTHAKGTKKAKEHKVSFNGKKATKPTNLCK
jgi:hypothetical protein